MKGKEKSRRRRKQKAEVKENSLKEKVPSFLSAFHGANPSTLTNPKSKQKVNLRPDDWFSSGSFFMVDGCTLGIFFDHSKVVSVL